MPAKVEEVAPAPEKRNVAARDEREATRRGLRAAGRPNVVVAAWSPPPRPAAGC